MITKNGKEKPMKTKCIQCGVEMEQRTIEVAGKTIAPQMICDNCIYRNNKQAAYEIPDYYSTDFGDDIDAEMEAYTIAQMYKD